MQPLLRKGLVSDLGWLGNFRFHWMGIIVYTREIPSLIEGGGFRMEHMDTAYLAGFPKSWTHCFWGTAVPKASS